MRRWRWSAFEPGKVVGECIGDAGVPGGFAVPAAGLRVGVEVLDVGELVAKCGREFGSGDEVVAGLVLLTELPDVAAAQDAQLFRRPIVGVSERSLSPGRSGHATSLIVTETGHTVLNHLPSFSSLPIFDVSRSGPRALVQPP